MNGDDPFCSVNTDFINPCMTSAVTIDVIASNDTPVANNDSATTSEDTLVNIIVLSNDSDPDVDTLTTTGVVSNPSNGLATLKADGTIDYTPNADFNGQDSFVYSISDGNGGMDTATGEYHKTSDMASGGFLPIVY